MSTFSKVKEQILSDWLMEFSGNQSEDPPTFIVEELF